LAKLSLVELDAEIDRCRTRLKIAPTSQLRKSFESRFTGLSGIAPSTILTEVRKSLSLLVDV
jgi:hypothetical protein